MLYVQHWSFKAGYHQKGAEKFLGGGGDYPGVEMIGRYHAPGSLEGWIVLKTDCLLYTSPSPRDLSTSRMPSSA